MSDPLAVAREALQAIRDITSKRRVPWERVLSDHAERALVALEAADAAQAERDEKIRQHAEWLSWAIDMLDRPTDDMAVKGVAALRDLLALLAAKTTTEPEDA